MSGKQEAKQDGNVPAPQAAPAASLQRYWVEESNSYSQPREVEGTQSIPFRFGPHEALCRSRYGKDWFNLCARSTGMSGKKVQGELSPPLAGVWDWRSDLQLNFTPDGAWPPGQEYRLPHPENMLPADTELMSELSFRTSEIMPQARGDFKFDPQDLKTMAVSGSIRFNYPMDKQSVSSRLKLLPQGEGLLLGETTLSWSNANSLLFSAPVLALPEAGSSVNVSLGVGALAQSGGKPGKGMDFHIKLPGKNNLFQLTEVQSLVSVTENMRARQSLALEFSLPVTPREVQPALSVLLLPRQRVDTEQNKNAPPYSWWSMAEISDDILALSTPVDLSLDEAADKASLYASFGFKQELEPGRSLLVTIPRGLAGTDGLALSREAAFLVQVPSFTEELRIMQNGAILPLAGAKTLSLYSRNLDAISYEAFQIRPEFINHFVSGNYGSFSNPQNYNFQMEQLSVVTRGSLPLTRKDAQSAQFSSLDLAPMLKNDEKGLFLIRLNGQRADNNVVSEQRFVLLTDLGIIHKSMADNSNLIFTAQLSEGKAARDVTVKILGINGLPVFEGKSDKDGKLAVPNLDGLPPEKRPVAIVASQGKDLAFLPIQDHERAVNYSKFDVGGNYSVNGLDAYLFNERDLFRPGEEARFGFIVRQGRWDEQKLQGLPLKAVLYDSRGNQFAVSKISLDASGLGSLQYPLPETAPTGGWHLDLTLADDEYGAVLQSSSFRVEEFQPDSLRLTLRLSPKAGKGWLRPADIDVAGKGLVAQLNLMNLFGAPAAGNHVQASIEANPSGFRFPQYQGWSFYDAAPRASSLREDLPQGDTDEDGDFSWTLDARYYAGATSALSVRAEGFDAAGGRSVKSSASVLLSPLDYVVGWRSSSNLNYLRQGTKADVELLALDSNLESLDLNGLKLETLALSYIKSLVKDDNGQYRYVNTRQEEELSSRPFQLSRSGTSLPLDLSVPGQRLLRIRNAEGTIVASLPYTVAGDAVASFGQDREPFLSARLDKEDYRPGDEVEVFLTTPYSGTGLITVERDDVVALVWFKAKAGSHVQRIRLPKNFEGKAYLNVTYFRSLEDKDIFTKPLSSAIVPFTVNMDGRDLGLKLQVLPQGRRQAEQKSTDSQLAVSPGQPFHLRVTAKQPGKAIVFAVDEGILQMTSYRSPDPLKALLGDRALQVSTYQYLDLLMPEYRLMASALSAYGGGEGLNFAEMGQNPFRRPGEESAVFWSGIIEVGPKGTDLQITPPPHFNGQLRIMAVGCSPKAVSSARSDVKVQAEVVIQPALPLFVAPGDVFDAAFTLTDMSGLAPAWDADKPEARGRSLRVDVAPGPGLELLSPMPDAIDLFDARQQTLRLRFRALDRLGGNSLLFSVSPLDGQPGGKVERPVGLSVRPAIARTTELSLGRLEKDGNSYSSTQSFQRRLYPQYTSFSASLAALPLPAARGLMEYLNKYPYTCTEQLVSGAFPALILYRHPELAPHGEDYTPEALSKRISTTLAMLAQRRSGGSFSLWQGSYDSDIFLDSYVADFLTSAEEMGVSVPYRMKNELMYQLENSASQPPHSMYDARRKAYAAWVLTRNGKITTNILATLQSWFKRYQPEWEQDIAAVFMAGCWQLMQQQDEAERLIDAYRPGPTRDWGPFGDFDALTERSFYLSVLATHFKDRLHAEQSQTVLDDMMELAASRRYVTISAAQAARALMLYSQGLSADLASAEISARTADGKDLPLPQPGTGAVPAVELKTAEVDRSLFDDLASLSFRASGPAFWHLESTGFDRELPLKPLSQGLEVSREFRRPDGEAATDIRQGDEIIVVIRARALGKAQDSVAIYDLLPGCFEMVLAEAGQSVESGTAQGSRLDDSPMRVAYVERREDRLLLFPNLGTKDTVFRYRVKAVNTGSFTLPPVSAEAMYNPTLRAHSAAGEIIVKE